MYVDYQESGSEYHSEELLDLQLPHSKTSPKFDTIFAPSQEIDTVADKAALQHREQFTKEQVSEAIDDYFDFERPLTKTEKRKKAIITVYKDKQREEERFRRLRRGFFSGENDSELTQKTLKKEKKKIENLGEFEEYSDDYYRKGVSGGWNSDTKTGDLFDPDLKMKEIFRFGRGQNAGIDMDRVRRSHFDRRDKFEVERHGKGRGGGEGGLRPAFQYGDLAEVREVIEKQNNREMEGLARKQEAKIEFIEELLTKEMAKREVRFRRFFINFSANQQIEWIR